MTFSCPYNKTTQLTQIARSNMTITNNITREENQTTIEQLYCSAQLGGKVVCFVLSLKISNGLGNYYL